LRCGICKITKTAHVFHIFETVQTDPDKHNSAKNVFAQLFITYMLNVLYDHITKLNVSSYCWVSSNINYSL